VDPYGLGIDLESNWTGEMLRAQIANGRVLSGPTIEALAAIAGIDALGLSATVESWNADVAAGADSTFEKPVPILQPVSTPPFYAVELRPAIIGMTFPGLRIDDKARVLDAAGRPISGLYAAGEIAGGLDGEVYSGGGTSIGNALVFGRIAGMGAALFSQTPRSS
jgi:fumarate reductase flavoprotein subunit